MVVLLRQTVLGSFHVRHRDISPDKSLINSYKLNYTPCAPLSLRRHDVTIYFQRKLVKPLKFPMEVQDISLSRSFYQFQQRLLLSEIMNLFDNSCVVTKVTPTSHQKLFFPENSICKTIFFNSVGVGTVVMQIILVATIDHNNFQTLG
jgi:hypothetical protein